ncbi:ABC transporter ATP-binding protein, partial [Candidatus Frankia alpina]
MSAAATPMSEAVPGPSAPRVPAPGSGSGSGVKVAGLCKEFRLG